MQKGLVSLLTPCYNTGHLIHRLLDSVLAQTYPYIEMFVIDDGSTDNSERIIKKYIPRFEEKGYSLSYHYQENGGQSVAIKYGLQLINGEFLAWPDSDDFYASSEAIAKMVDRLANASSEFAMVRTMERFVDENTLDELFVVGQNAKEEECETLFEDCLFANNGFFWGAGAYMLRVPILKEITDYDIYAEKHAGQNWQLFLPILYSYKCLTIKEVLYSVLQRKQSHGRGGYAGYERLLLRIQVYERTILETLDRIYLMSDEQRECYKLLIQKKYNRERFFLAYKNRKRYDVVMSYNWWKEKRVAISKINIIRYYVTKLRLEFMLDFCLKLYHKLL